MSLITIGYIAIVAMLALIMLGLLIGTATLFVGLVVIMPVIGGCSCGPDTAIF